MKKSILASAVLASLAAALHSPKRPPNTRPATTKMYGQLGLGPAYANTRTR